MAENVIIDPVSFSDDAEDSFITQNLRATIGQVSQRLELNSDDGPFSDPIPSLQFLNSRERGAPDGQGTIMQRSAFSLNSLQKQPKSRKRKPATSTSICPSPSMTSFPDVLPPDNNNMLAVDLSSATSTNSQENSWSTSDEPIDLSNGPLDLRKNSKSAESTFICLPTDRYFSDSESSSEETLDSFDSAKIFHNYKAQICSQSTSLSMSYPSNITSVQGRVPSVCESTDIYDEAKLPVETQRPMSTRESSGNFPTYQPQRSSISTHAKLSSADKDKSISEIVSKEITCTVKAIITSSDSLPSTQSMSSSLSGNINQTYTVGESFFIPHENTDAFKHAEGASVTETTDGSTIVPTEIEPDLGLINRGTPASCFVDPRQPSSSNRERADDTTWSVKEALENMSPGPSLKFTFTRTQTSNAISAYLQSCPMGYQALETWPIILDSRLASEISPDSVYSRRNVVGSSGYHEESTILSEASQVVPLGTTAETTVVSHPDTPDITLHQRYTNDSPIRTFPVSHVGKSSTPHRAPTLTKTHPKHASNHVGHCLQKTESPRRRLLKQRAFECHGSDSILNIGFRQDSNAPKKKRKKKKSLLKTLKQQLFCAKESNNMSVSSIANDPEVRKVPHRCPSSVQTKPSPCQQLFKILPRNVKLSNCMKNVNDTCPTTVFETLTDSSTGLNSWCRHIRDVTRVTPIHEQVVPSLEESKSASKPASADTQSSPKTLKESKKSNDSSSPESKDSLTYDRSHHPYSTPSLLTGINATDDTHDGHFKKPLAPRHKSHISKSAPILPSSPKYLKSEKRRKQGSEPMLASTPLRVKSSSHHSPSTKQCNPQSKKEAEDLDTSDVRINLINKVGRDTAEWLATYVGDTESKCHRMRCDEQPNRNVLFQLCSRCKIKIQWPENNSSVFRLRKTKRSRAPTESDIRHLVRGLRRKTESIIL